MTNKLITRQLEHLCEQMDYRQQPTQELLSLDMYASISNYISNIKNDIIFQAKLLNTDNKKQTQQTITALIGYEINKANNHINTCINAKYSTELNTNKPYINLRKGAQ